MCLVMKKEDTKIRYCVQHENHARVVFSAICSLMEHQSLVDLAIRCGNNTIHAHKCILAANSPYFREQLEKNIGTEQVVVTGIDFSVMKAVVEFMYCGETQILEDHLKQLAAVAKLFKIRGLPGVAPDHIEADNASYLIPPPIFLSKKPKYSSAYIPYSMNNQLNPPNLHISPQISSLSNASHNNTVMAGANMAPSAHAQSVIIDRNDNRNLAADLTTSSTYTRRLKRKYVRTEAEKACAKEAAASRLALETIQKELATSQFVLDDVVSNNAQFDPGMLVGYDPVDQNQLMRHSTDSVTVSGAEDKADKVLSVESAAEKIKHIFGQELPNNVEIMFKTSDGNFVNVTDEMLQAITREALQFQVIDENGEASEIQFLKHGDKSKLPNLNLPSIVDATSEANYVFLDEQSSATPQMYPTNNDNKVIQQKDPLSDLSRANTAEDLFSTNELLNTTQEESITVSMTAKKEVNSEREVMFVEGIGNVVCSETVRKEDDLFFEVNPRYYEDGDGFHNSPKRKLLKSNCTIEDMIISPKKSVKKPLQTFSLEENMDVITVENESDRKSGPKRSLKEISEM